MLLEVIHGVPADVADGHLAVLGILVDLLGQLLAALLRQLREGQADDTAVVLGIDAQVGGLDGLFDGLEQRSRPKAG